MRAALFAAALLGCTSGRSGRPCPAPPPPSAEAFATCGGMLYHTPPGNAVRYSVKFVNALGADFELVDVCILVDGAPLFTAKEIEAAPKDVKWDGRLSYAQHRVQVQISFKPKGAPTTAAVRATRDIAAIDGGALEITVYQVDKKPTLKLSLPKDTPEPKCDY